MDFPLHPSQFIQKCLRWPSTTFLMYLWNTIYHVAVHKLRTSDCNLPSEMDCKYYYAKSPMNPLWLLRVYSISMHTSLFFFLFFFFHAPAPWPMPSLHHHMLHLIASVMHNKSCITNTRPWVAATRLAWGLVTQNLINESRFLVNQLSREHSYIPETLIYLVPYHCSSFSVSMCHRTGSRQDVSFSAEEPAMRKKIVGSQKPFKATLPTHIFSGRRE